MASAFFQSRFSSGRLLKRRICSARMAAAFLPLLFFQKECTVGTGLHTQIRIQGLNTLVQYPPAIHWRQSKAVNSQKKFQIKFMMESVYLFLINILVIVLGMIIIFHKRATAEIIDHGRIPEIAMVKSSDQVSMGYNVVMPSG